VDWKNQRKSKGEQLMLVLGLGIVLEKNKKEDF
jgi:hypothetical protein